MIHVVLEASNGNEAFDLIMTVQPDLILTDIDMPETAVPYENKQQACCGFQDG